MNPRPPSLPAPLSAACRQLLVAFADTMIGTQKTAPTDPDRGAFVCPAGAHRETAVHSRSAEMLYPLAVLARETSEARYSRAAILAGDWLVRIQQSGGAWGEESPAHDGWTGTTADQLLALAGAYPLLESELTPGQRRRWRRAIARAGDFIALRMPRAHLNYAPTCAVALCLSRRVMRWPRWRWRLRELRFIQRTLRAITPEGLLDGEGGGVDAGYNLAQTIGYLALYALLTRNGRGRDVAARLLRVHAAFIYPNGAVDNSWGTRAYKWTYESGTKTAPGVPFTFAVLLDQDPTFAPLLERALDYLARQGVEDGWVGHGPHARRHPSTSPPCNYGTFARAQSLALALTYGRPAAPPASTPAATPPRLSFFPSLRVAVVRTPRLMATVSAYAVTSQYSRAIVSRGGSITSLWMEGYGELGFVQASSPVYDRSVEPMHLPPEERLQSVTPRIELRREGRVYSSIFETDARMQAASAEGGVEVRAAGELRDAGGEGSGVGYVLTHRFVADRVVKQAEIHAARAGDSVQIVEPLVRLLPGDCRLVAPDRVEVVDDEGRVVAELRCDIATGMPRIRIGAQPGEYWAPFPGVECAPVEIEVAVGPAGEATVRYELVVLPRTDAAR